MSNLVCPVCGGKALLMYPDHPGYMEPDTFGIYHCTGCNTSFADPLKVDGRLYELIYANHGQVPGYDRYFRYASKALEADDPEMKLMAESCVAMADMQRANQPNWRPPSDAVSFPVVFLSPIDSAWADRNSVIVNPTPSSSATVRNGRSVTAAMGASSTGTSRWMGPIRTAACVFTRCGPKRKCKPKPETPRVVTPAA